jgi:hypothetical protein
MATSSAVRKGANEEGRSLVGRIASIMDAFDGDSAVLTLVELSRLSGLPKSTAHRLAEQLRELGWLERDYRGYRVGIRLFELGGLAVGHSQLREAALPHLHALATRTGHAVQLGVLCGEEVVYLERIVVGPYRLPTRPGARMPAYCTGLGKAMLAFDELAAERVLQSELPSRTPHTITSPTRAWAAWPLPSATPGGPSAPCRSRGPSPRSRYRSWPPRCSRPPPTSGTSGSSRTGVTPRRWPSRLRAR